MDKLISIIVPVYNTERSLIEKCIDSLMNQTYAQLEIIIVDDGSKQSTADICNSIAHSDSRISVVHKKNGGLSSARNAGLEIAKGELISFVDSDDFLHPNAIEKMYQVYSIANIPIVCMQSVIINDSGQELYHFGNDSGNVDIIEWNKYIDGICRKKLSESVCDKLFEAKLFNNRRFESGRLNEDFLFLSKMLMDKVDVSTIDFAGYYYLKHDGTITSHSTDLTSLKDAVRNSSELADMAENEYSDVFLSFVYSTLFQAKVLLTLIPSDCIGAKEWNNCSDTVKRYIHLAKKCGLREIDRLTLRCLIMFPKLTKFLYRLLKK